MTINSYDDTYWDANKCEWVPVPKDEYNLPSVEFLKSNGVDIVKSEVITETHRSMDEGERYKQKIRKDYFTNNPFSPLVCLFYRSVGGTCRSNELNYGIFLIP